MAQPVNAAVPFTAAPAGEGLITDDQRFLLTVIFGTYFGPHLKGEWLAHKSAMQRVVERLPLYTPNQLAGSKMMVAQMLHAYYYILRKASQSVIVAPSLLLKFFRNTLPPKVLGPESNYPRFMDLFSTDLHPCSVVEERLMAIDNIVFIINPSTTYLKEEVVARFKSLTGLQEFVLEKDAAKLPVYVTDKSFYEVVAREARSEGHSRFFIPPQGSHRRRCKSNVALDVKPLQMVPHEGSPSSTSAWFSGVCDTYLKAQLDPKVVFSPLSMTEVQSHSAVAACSAGVGVVGNADVGRTGSTTWRVNLVESKDCYLFQVSLAGVRRDQTFSCEYDMDGEVLIGGEIATGGKVVESRTGDLYPPGHFSLCFQLPGRVDPMRSNCNFGSDGIFEGVAETYFRPDLQEEKIYILAKQRVVEKWLLYSSGQIARSLTVLEDFPLDKDASMLPIYIINDEFHEAYWRTLPDLAQSPQVKKLIAMFPVSSTIKENIARNFHFIAA
ncbi:increased DNA methylation 2-like [Syzygium oleosum]|uniref:increased DNA methylation 2-like n=1 Tax=Syzygium oleosum TaxID=219896 RepID=UPI0024BB9D44|nr:increased DNA methylation 2-like [Syzygium oleosum]